MQSADLQYDPEEAEVVLVPGTDPATAEYDSDRDVEDVQEVVITPPLALGEVGKSRSGRRRQAPTYLATKYHVAYS